PAVPRGNIDYIVVGVGRASPAGERLASGLLAATAAARGGHGPVRALPAVQGRLHGPQPGLEAAPASRLEGGGGRPAALAPGRGRRAAATGAARAAPAGSRPRREDAPAG